MAKTPNISTAIVELLQEKASHSPCSYKISAIAFDKKGDVLGHVTNSHSKNWNVLDKYGKGRQGTAQHAERRLLARYGERVKSIVICRIGRSGNLRPINPCKTCLKAAAKYGAKIISVLPGRDEENEEAAKRLYK